MYLWGTALTVLLAASNKSNINVDQLKLRLQMGYEATEEARGLVAEQQYTKAALSYADALNLGRKPTLAFQELDVLEDSKINNDDDDEENSNDDLMLVRHESLQWLVGTCCESSRLNVDHLNDLEAARADAWAACVFSLYQKRRPLECMKAVCEQDHDSFGEFQTCQQLLKLPKEELPEEEERERLSKRLQELDLKLNQK